MPLKSKFFSFLVITCLLFIATLKDQVFSSPSSETKVTTAEGVVYLYEVKNNELSKIHNLAIGEFIRYVAIDVIEVRRGLNRELCYIPEEIRIYAKEKLKPNLPVLIKSIIRKKYKTKWDLVAIGVDVREGYMYSDGVVVLASPIDIKEILKDVKELRINVSATEASSKIGALTVAYTPSAEKGVPVEEESEPMPPVPVIPPEPTPPESPEPSAPASATISYVVNPSDSSTTITVDGTTYSVAGGSDSAGDGTNEKPWRTITYALTQVSSGTIYLVQATYSAGETFPLTMKSNVNISGRGSENSIISGDGTYRVIDVLGATGVTLSNLRLRNGTGVGRAGSLEGGAIDIDSSSSITLDQCLIGSTTGSADANSSTASGGGIHVAGNSTLVLTRSTVEYNRSGSPGGGIHLTGGSTVRIAGCIISNNGITAAGQTGNGIAVRGNANLVMTAYGDTNLNGVIESGESFISGNTVSGNDSVGVGSTGGGITIDTSGNGTISYTRIVNNGQTNLNSDGSGILIFNPTSTVTLTNCIIAGNGNGANAITSAVHIQDAVANVTMMNCTVANNLSSLGVHGGIFLDDSQPTITNCIISGNSGYGIYESNAGGDPTLLNFSDLFGNTTNDYWDNATGAHVGNAIDNPVLLNVSDCDIKYGDPFFNSSYKHGAGAITVVDTGTNTGAPAFDIVGTIRPQGAFVDLGAYERRAAGDPPITGRVYDSITGESISSPVVGIYRAGTITSLSTTTSNPYTFNVDPGNYFIAVSKSGYAFPSQIVASTVAGDHGDTFTASTDPLTINIPMDPDGYLYIEKTVNKKRVLVGEIVTYNIKIQNKYWFKAVSNAVLVDELVNGFKYIDNSSSSHQPSSISHKLLFNLGTVNANSTTNLSYQVRVGSGIPPGRYKAAAVCQKETTNANISNTSSSEVEVIEDALFTKGTIIGKVFYDIDGNGVQDGPLTLPSPQGGEACEARGEGGETGIPGVKIATEYGVVVETDKDGKYHIADVPPGRHLLKIMPDSIPEFLQELGGVEYTTDNPYLVKITEGLLAKVNFGVTQIEPLTQTLSPEGRGKGEGEFFIVALGEGTLRNLSTSGNIEMASSGRDDRYDDGLRVDGRLAFYLKGKVLGKYLITASLDTDRQPGKIEDIKRLFTNLDPDKYYPVYGDASQIDYSAQDTQDMGYVLIEWDNSFAKWGNFHTNIPMYSRTLSGGKVEYRSVKKTKFGEPYTEVDIIGATARQKPAHNEFVGTGGSLYYLKHRDVIEGSEKVRVEVRDRVSRVPIESVPLQEERDYEIDYDTGRILLKRPLNISNWAYKSSIVSNDILSGERVYLVVDYEYYITGGLSKQAVGGRAKQHIGNHIDVEGMYIEEEKEDSPYQLYRGDSTLRINENTYITAGYTHTKETQLGSGTSIDGGLSFINLNEDYSNDKSGSAVDVKAETRLFKNTNVLLSYNREDPYYSTTDSLSTAGSQKYIGSIITQIKKNMYAGVKHLTQRLLSGTIGEETVGTTDTHITTALFDWTPDPWDMRLEYQHQNVTRVLSGFTYMGFLPYNNNDFVAGRLGYSFTERLHAYARAQGTVQGRTDNQITLGSDIKILKDTYINLAETVGNLGDSTLLGVTSQLREDTDVYANIETGNHMDLGKFTRTSYGQTVQLTKDSKVYASHDYSSYQERLIRGNLLGYDKKINNNILLGLTYERSNIENAAAKSETNNLINRDSGSISLGYLDVDHLRISTKLECRNDRGETETKRQWVTENTGQWYITKDLTVLGRANWGWTDNRTEDETEAKFNELGAGLAFRPVKWDKLNLLAKYSYITDLPPDEQVEFIEETEQRRHVIGLEGGYDICRYLGLIGKFAYRSMEEKVGARDWTDSDVYLYIGRINFHVTNKWDIAAEYRTLTNHDIEDKKSGWLVEVDREIFKYIRMGAGYNFTDYDDDLRNDDNYDAKGWFVRVSGKY